ncbi:hypothetical protein HPB50_000673 [Hyalomma asiaticum]|uniref:Uncharacterized protein n=1 Tax=Hyalomma asiaticum TaxID=266040 RepID=A0ACB7RI93_HYAAI|nr:hypothetical protein HPB50_000673 [Hyalomma asiaticum]
MPAYSGPPQAHLLAISYLGIPGTSLLTRQQHAPCTPGTAETHFSCVLPRGLNRHSERPNLKFVHRFNWEAQQFIEMIKTYCRRPSKLPPLRFLAADSLHPSFAGVALLAEMLKNALSRRVIQGAPGGSSLPTTQERLNKTSAADPHHRKTTWRRGRVPHDRGKSCAQAFYVALRHRKKHYATHERRVYHKATKPRQPSVDSEARAPK